MDALSPWTDLQNGLTVISDHLTTLSLHDPNHRPEVADDIERHPNRNQYGLGVSIALENARLFEGRSQLGT